MSQAIERRQVTGAAGSRSAANSATTYATNRVPPTQTAAPETAAILCGVAPGDEGIIPSFTFVSTANVYVVRGAVPVFVDVGSDTLSIDETRDPRRDHRPNQGDLRCPLRRYQRHNRPCLNRLAASTAF
jgi:dTDP-4-amino-4,6-dideoxygalactose transaminase